MMGSGIPTQSSLNDLLILLQGLQAAADPKQVKANIEKIAAERAKYDAAVAAAQAKTIEANTATIDAQSAAGLAEVASAKLDKKQAQLAAQAEDLKADKARVVADREQLDAQLSTATELMKSLATDRDNLTLEFSRKNRELDKAFTELANRSALLATSIADADAVKAEYTAKLNQFKALAV